MSSRPIRKRLIDLLQGQDFYGAPVQFYFKGDSHYGTILGGTCSLLLSAFFFLFVELQLLNWIFQPDYSLETLTGYIPPATVE